MNNVSPAITIDRHPSPAHKSVVSRAIGFLGKGAEYCRELGAVTGLRWYLSKICSRLHVPGLKRIVVKLPDVLYPLTVRMFPSSDDFVFDEIFVRHEYGPACSLEDPKVIIDLGANVGYASAVFASRYPRARILAVEPDPGSYAVCKQNLAPYGTRIQAVLGAVWSRPAQLTLSTINLCDGREWGTRVEEAPPGVKGDVQAWDMVGLLDMTEQRDVDLLKIDIEGSEEFVFAADADRWLPRVRNLCIELHDDRCREVFFRALAGFEYEMSEYRDLTFCFNLRRAARAAQS